MPEIKNENVQGVVGARRACHPHDLQLQRLLQGRHQCQSKRKSCRPDFVVFITPYPSIARTVLKILIFIHIFTSGTGYVKKYKIGRTLKKLRFFVVAPAGIIKIYFTPFYNK
jgi:hypothetical protein